MRTKILIIIVAIVLIGCRSNQNVESNVNRRVNFNRTNTYEVEYDFHTGEFKKNNNQLKVDNSVVFKIDNINNLAYDAKIQCKDSTLAASFTTELSALLAEAKSISTDTQKNNHTASSKIANGNNTITSEDVSDKVEVMAKEKKENVNQAKTKVINEVNNISKLEVLLKQKTVIEDSLKGRTQKLTLLKENKKKDSIDIVKINGEIKEIDGKIQTINTQINIATEEEKVKLNQEITKLKTDRQEKITQNETLKKDSISIVAKIAGIDIQKLESQLKNKTDSLAIFNTIKDLSLKKFAADSEKFINTYGAVESIYKKSLKIISSYKETISISQNPRLTSKIYNSLYKEKLQGISSEIYLIQSDIVEFESKYNDLQKLYNYTKYNPGLDDVLNDGGKTKLYAYVDSLKSLADKMNENFKADNLDKMITYVKQVILLLEKEETYTVISNPVQPMNDIVIFDIDIKKRSNNSVEELYQERKFKHREFTYGGTRFDLGIGLSGAWFPNVKNYEFSPVDVDIKNSEGAVVGTEKRTHIYQKSKQTYSPSIIGMFTASYRSTHYITFGASVGMGVDLKDDKVQLNSFYVGPSVIVGKYERFVITAGIVMKEVDILKKGYEINGNYPISQNNGDDFKAKEYRAGGFLSLTFNLTKGVRDNMKVIRNNYIP
ncbi:MAG: hypothetical protein E2600_17265 [Chryseobacterium sp.]|nr:hypothetical protein [Chryseobacterium sp.]